MRRGLTLIEIIIVFGVLATLLAFTSLNLTLPQHRSVINTTLTTLSSDLHQMQLKAISGDTEGRGTITGYGVYFSPSGYTLFHGSAYSGSDPTNVVITLDPSLTFTNVTFPASTVIFSPGSGEVVGFTPGSNTFTLRHTLESVDKTFTLNRYGVITQIN